MVRLIDDFTPIIHNMDGRTIRVYAVADVHIGAREADVAGFSRFLKRIERDGDAYLVVCGDVINNGLRSASCPTDIYNETMPPAAQVDEAVRLLAPVADRILGAVGGNHEHRSKKAVDWDPMHEVMVRLGVGDRYRPNMAFIRVRLADGNLHDIYSLMLVHGRSAATKKRFQYAVEGVDAIISAHTHDGLVEKPARLVFSQKNNVVIRPLVSLTATSWVGFGGYAARGLMLPKATSDPQALVLEWTGSNNRQGTIRTIW